MKKYTFGRILRLGFYFTMGMFFIIGPLFHLDKVDNIFVLGQILLLGFLCIFLVVYDIFFRKELFNSKKRSHLLYSGILYLIGSAVAFLAVIMAMAIPLIPIPIVIAIIGIDRLSKASRCDNDGGLKKFKPYTVSVKFRYIILILFVITIFALMYTDPNRQQYVYSNEQPHGD